MDARAGSQWRVSQTSAPGGKTTIETETKGAGTAQLNFFADVKTVLLWHLDTLPIRCQSRYTFLQAHKYDLVLVRD